MNTTLNRDKVLESVDVGTFIDQLAVLMPIYRQGGGDMTRVVLQDRTSWEDPRPLPAVLKGIARHFAVDLVAVRERYGDILGKRLYVPLPLSPHLVLVPLKMRSPLIQKDGTTGYVASHVVERVIDGKGTTDCQLIIGGSDRIDCLQSSKFVKSQLRSAMIVQTFYRKTMSLPATP